MKNFNFFDFLIYLLMIFIAAVFCLGIFKSFAWPHPHHYEMCNGDPVMAQLHQSMQLALHRSQGTTERNNVNNRYNALFSQRLRDIRSRHPIPHIENLECSGDLIIDGLNQTIISVGRDTDIGYHHARLELIQDLVQQVRERVITLEYFYGVCQATNEK